MTDRNGEGYGRNYNRAREVATGKLITGVMNGIASSSGPFLGHSRGKEKEKERKKTFLFLPHIKAKRSRVRS